MLTDNLLLKEVTRRAETPPVRLSPRSDASNITPEQLANVLLSNGPLTFCQSG